MTTSWPASSRFTMDIAPPSPPRERARHAALERAIAALTAELLTLTPEVRDDCPACAQVRRIRG